MITSDKVFKVVKRLDRANQKYNFAEVDMVQGYRKETPCGTVCCHGGLYVLAKGEELQATTGYEGENYIAGASWMAEDLGFTGGRWGNLPYTDLLKWADNNPEIWGNYSGKRMFISEAAFCKRDNMKNLTVEDIINHWEEVGMRLYMEENL